MNEQVYPKGKMIVIHQYLEWLTNISWYHSDYKNKERVSDANMIYIRNAGQKSRKIIIELVLAFNIFVY